MGEFVGEFLERGCVMGEVEAARVCVGVGESL